MDVKSLISSTSSIMKDPPHCFLNGILSDKSGLLVKGDALEAVKLDPAVLEAQVTVHADSANKAANLNKSRDVVIENKKVQDSTPPPSVTTPAESPTSFDDMVMQHEAALLSLTPHQLEMLMQYADALRRERTMTQRYLECAFCKNNGKPQSWYSSHVLRDLRGRVRCPILRGFRCRRCGATGDEAHTIKYCPLADTRSSCSGNSSQ